MTPEQIKRLRELHEKARTAPIEQSRGCDIVLAHALRNAIPELLGEIERLQRIETNVQEVQRGAEAAMSEAESDVDFECHNHAVNVCKTILNVGTK